MRAARVYGAIFLAVGIVQLIAVVALGADEILADLGDVTLRVLLALVFIAIGWFLWNRDE